MDSIPQAAREALRLLEERRERLPIYVLAVLVAAAGVACGGAPTAGSPSSVVPVVAQAVPTPTSVPTAAPTPTAAPCPSGFHNGTPGDTYSGCYPDPKPVSGSEWWHIVHRDSTTLASTMDDYSTACQSGDLVECRQSAVTTRTVVQGMLNDLAHVAVPPPAAHVNSLIVGSLNDVKAAMKDNINGIDDVDLDLISTGTGLIEQGTGLLSQAEDEMSSLGDQTYV
jgi:hypothetical protein